MPRTAHKMLLLPALVLGALFSPHAAYPLDITPFYTVNQSPVVQIFGLPPADNALVVPAGRVEALLSVDVASNFGVDENSAEQITLDGEIYRTTIALRYGVSRGVEVGLDIPYVAESTGFLDGMIEGFHRVFGVGQGGRDQAPSNRLLFRYTRDGVDRFDISHPNGGLGDIRLSGAVQLYRDGGKPGRAASLRASLKLPTGESESLHGSGSTDFALWLTAADDYRSLLGRWTIFGAAGGMALTKGDVLRDQQRELVGFGTVGGGWHATDWLGLKTQLNVHTPFYRHSSLQELGAFTVQWLLGGTVAFTDKTSLDIGVSEDLLVISASPDIAFHLALRTRF